MRKIRRQKRNKRTFVILSVAFFVLFTVSGYAFFTETLSIGGTAKNSDYITNNKLQVDLVQTSGRYTTGTFGGVTWSSESYDGINNLSTYFVKQNATTTNRTNNYTITLRNPYSINLTNGTVTTSLVSGTFSTRTATIQRTTLTPNQTGTIRLNLTHRNSTVGNAQVLVTVTYRLNGVYKYFYFRVFIS